MRSEEFILKKPIREDGEISPLGTMVPKKKRKVDAKKNVEEIAKQIKSVK